VAEERFDGRRNDAQLVEVLVQEATRFAAGRPWSERHPAYQ
jgi:hypothetical protein